MHDDASRPSRAVRAGVRMAMLLILGTGACGESARDDRVAILGTAAGQHVVGVWDITMQSDPRQSAGAGQTARTVAGTIALTENRHGRLSSAELSGVTHQGAADIDFNPLGWVADTDEGPQLAVARVSPRGAAARAADGDSLVVVIGPGTSRFVVRLFGVVSGDDASGSWRASAFSGGGGGGRFVMHRRR